MTPRFRGRAPDPRERLLDVLEAAFVNAPSGVAFAAEDGRLVHANPALEALLGRPARELLDMHWQELIHPDDLPKSERAVERALDRTGAFDIEVRVVGDDGDETWVRVKGRVLTDPAVAPAQLVVHVEDVTHRRAAVQWAGFLAAVASSVADAVFAADRDGHILFLNAAAEWLYGLRSHDVAGKSVTATLAYPEDRPLAEAWRLRLLAGEQPVGPVLIRHRRSDGTPFDAEVSVSPVRDATGSLIGVTGVVRDVSERLAQERSASTLRAVVDAAAEGILGVDAEDVIRFVSPAAERILGWRAAELLGGSIWRLVEERAKGEGVAVRDALVAGRSIRREVVLQHRSGEAVAVSLTASPILGGDGTYQGAAITILDLSESRRAQFEAERSRAQLQRVIDNAPAIVVFKDVDGRCVLINRRGSEVVGLEPSEVVGRTDHEVFPPDFAEQAREEDRQVMAAGRPLTFEKDVPLPGGGSAPYLVTKFPILGRGDEPDGVGLIGADITQLRRGEADRAQLAALVEAAPDAIMTVDADDRIGTWNLGAERMLGLSADDAIGRAFGDLIPESELERALAIHAEVVAGRAVQFRIGGKRADGSLFPAEVSAAPLVRPGGGYAGQVAIVRDITELMETELQLRERAAQLERSNADLEAFAYAASHDLQEPLRSIQMSAEVVRRAAAERLDDDEARLLDEVDAAATRMSAQVRTLLQSARIALGQPDDEPVPVRAALEDALTALRAAIRQAGARIKVREPLPSAAVPRTEVALVLQNVLANAINYRRPGVPPEITISGSTQEGCVEVRVADNGIGLSQADLSHIFDIFGRAQHDIPGTGMGLAVCKRILERRGGTITAHSSGPGEGSAFVLRLPGQR